MKIIDVVAAVLLVIGGLNWGLVGIAKFDLVAALFGAIPFLQNTVYILVGLAALYQAVGLRSIQHRWGVTAHAHQS